MVAPWVPDAIPALLDPRASAEMLALLHVVVQSYSLGSTLPARTRATRCSSARCLSEGQDYMLQELNPAKAGILCGPPSPPGHAPPLPPLPPLTPRPSAYRLRSCRCPNHSTSHAARPPLTAHRSPLTAHRPPLTAHPAPLSSSGYVDAGELGRFMKLGRPAAAPSVVIN